MEGHVTKIILMKLKLPNFSGKQFKQCFNIKWNMENLGMLILLYTTALRKKEYEVRYMAEPVDEYAQQLKEFDGKKLQSTNKEELEIDDEDEKKKPEMMKLSSSRMLMKEVLLDT
eukprot:967773-Amphidinium_carterae.1